MLDIIFISYDEENADRNFLALKDVYPHARRIHGIDGIGKAHLEAAKLANTEFFYVVDGDTEVLPEFDFSYTPLDYDKAYVHIWLAQNPVNGLTYGNGGIKLFHKGLFSDVRSSWIDFTTSIGHGLKLMPMVASITRFNTSPLKTWRTAFREAVKLQLMVLHQDHEARGRLEAWCTGAVRGGRFAKWAHRGAAAGREWAKMYADQPIKLATINDYEWLRTEFEASAKQLNTLENKAVVAFMRELPSSYTMVKLSFITSLVGALYNPSCFTNTTLASFRDSLSEGQLHSKLWLIYELEKACVKLGRTRFNEILIVGGWYGILGKLLLDVSDGDGEPTGTSVVSVDIDPAATEFARTAWWQESNFKAITADMMTLDYSAVPITDKLGETMYTMSPDIIINTSAEHIIDPESWFDSLPKGKLVVIQTNNYFDCPEHVSCFSSLDNARQSFEFEKLLYAGEYKFDIYDRYMLIGLT